MFINTRTTWLKATTALFLLPAALGLAETTAPAPANKWDPAHKAVVLDSRNCGRSKHIIGLPSVVRAGKRLAVFYDGNAAAQIPPGVKSHMDRDIGLAWLDLPLVPPPR